MTKTEEALATALADGFNGIRELEQPKFTAEEFEMHTRFLVPIVERLIALRDVEARLTEHNYWHNCGGKQDNPDVYKIGKPSFTCSRRAELERQRDALLKERTP